MSLYVNRVRYKGGSPTLGASSGIINNAVINGHDFYDDNYNPAPPAHDYSQDYFTIEPIDGGNITLQFAKTGSPASFSVYYSTDGVNWRIMTTTNSVTLTGKVYLRANVNHWGGSTSNYWKFNIQQDYKIYGNIMSLIYDDNFLNQTTLKANYEFNGLFRNSTHLVDAENLVLAATTLTNNCYANMFRNCTSLTIAPELPETNLAHACYQSMFWDCTSLTTTPILPATNLATYCYNSMFRGCTSLNKVTCLATNISATNCLTLWLQNVSTNGTFVKNSSMSSWPSGDDGIPSGWTIVDYVA